MTPQPPRSLVVAAFAAIYLIWGSTYLGIRFAIESMPPFLMGGARFLLAGGVLYAWLRSQGAAGPTPAEWGNALLVGALLLGIGNGGVNWAEQRIPSSLVALIIAVTPLWFALLDWVRPGGTRPKTHTFVGIFVGFAGMVWLVAPNMGNAPGRIDSAGVLGVLAASIAWASGSLYARFTPKPETPLMGGALQMLAGGIVLTVAGVTMGEADQFSIYRVSRHSLVAFLYLTVVGSLVGFTAYSWLLKVSTPARVSTYAYVNPVIALLLGWAIGGETLTAQMLWAAVVIILGVVILSSGPPDRGEKRPA